MSEFHEPVASMRTAGLKGRTHIHTLFNNCPVFLHTLSTRMV